MIICKICKKTFKSLNNAHLATHNLLPNEYKRRFRVNYIFSKETRKIIGFTKIGNKNNLGRTFILKPAIKKKRIKLITKLNRRADIRRLRKKYMIGNQYAKGYRHTIKFRDRQREIIKNLWKDPKYRENIIKRRRKTYRKPSFKKLASERNTRLWENPIWRKKILKARLRK